MIISQIETILLALAAVYNIIMPHSFTTDRVCSRQFMRQLRLVRLTLGAGSILRRTCGVRWCAKQMPGVMRLSADLVAV